MLVRLLLSVDRRESSAAALETVKLAGELQQEGVVGIDLSGNPAVGEWSTWEPALLEARRLGLKLTIHAGEVRFLLISLCTTFFQLYRHRTLCE